MLDRFEIRDEPMTAVRQSGRSTRPEKMIQAGEYIPTVEVVGERSVQ